MIALVPPGQGVNCVLSDCFTGRLGRRIFETSQMVSYSDDQKWWFNGVRRSSSSMVPVIFKRAMSTDPNRRRDAVEGSASVEQPHLSPKGGEPGADSTRLGDYETDGFVDQNRAVSWHPLEH